MERLHKFMAHCGIASRRQAEEFIRDGRVLVNDEVVTELGVKIDPEKDVVVVDGKVLKPEKKVCYLLHKPRGYATTVDDDLGRKTVMDLLPEVKERIYPAGRLDFDSEGLIVLTNDGDAAYFLTHPSCGVRKVYEALVEGEVEDDTIETLLEKGVYLGAMRIKPIMAKIVKRQHDSTVVRVIVAEGVNREVRRLFAALGHEVKRLVRLEVGPFRIDGIARGKYRLATPQEIAVLHESMQATGKRLNSSPVKQSKKKYGQAAQRPGKPDPALYGKGERPRHAPLVLKHKNSTNKAEGANEGDEDDSYFDESALGAKKGQSSYRHSGKSNRSRGNVSHETFIPRSGKSKFQFGGARNLKKWDNRPQDNGMDDNRRRRSRSFNDHEEGLPFSNSAPHQKKRHHGASQGSTAKNGFAVRNDYGKARGESPRANHAQRFGDENYPSSFRRPPARFSEEERSRGLVERKRGDFAVNDSFRHQTKAKGAFRASKEQRGKWKANRSQNGFYPPEKKRQNQGRGKPQGFGHDKGFSKNKKGKPVGNKPVRHPLDK